MLSCTKRILTCPFQRRLWGTSSFHKMHFSNLRDDRHGHTDIIQDILADSVAPTGFVGTDSYDHNIQLKKIKLLLKHVGIKADASEFSTAFVHETAVQLGIAKESYQQLEFLGDSVLNFVVTKWLREEYSHLTLKKMDFFKQRLVRNDALAEAAVRLEFDKIVLFLNNEYSSMIEPRMHKKILADCFEAFIGALFENQGMIATERFIIQQYILPMRGEMGQQQWESASVILNPKCILINWCFPKFKAMPLFIGKQTGRGHNPIHTCRVLINDLNKFVATGKGASKKEAEQNAAKQAILILRESHADLDREKVFKSG